MYTGVHGEKTHADQPLQLSDPTSKVQGLHSLFKQLEDGYTVVLFGYGLSGSGKSYTLFGSKNEKGIVQLGMSKFPQNTQVKISAIVELYTSQKTTLAGGVQPVMGKLITLYADKRSAGFLKPIESKLESENAASEFESYLQKKVIDTDIDELIVKVDDYRVKSARVKATPLNPNSSRSHLVYIWSIVFPNKAMGHLIVMDMAGQEDPNVYRRLFFANAERLSMSMFFQSTDEEQLKKQLIDPRNNFTTVKEILREGIFINETIKQLSCFLYRQGGRPSFSYTPMQKAIEALEDTVSKEYKELNRQAVLIQEKLSRKDKLSPEEQQLHKRIIDLRKHTKKYEQSVLRQQLLEAKIKSKKELTYDEKMELKGMPETQKAILGQEKLLTPPITYAPNGAFANPNTEYEALQDPPNYLMPKSKGSSNVNTGMMPLLFMFMQYADQSKPTKFVMMCNIAPEADVVDQTMNTLEFAHKIKST